MPNILSTLSSDYGYVILVGTGSVFVNAWLMRNVMKARKEYKVEYPALYSDECQEFNCVQRAHQNYLEMYPVFIWQLFVGGLSFPRVASGFGVVYLAGRIAYSKGYYTADPEKRLRGRFMMIGMMGLVGLSVVTALRFLGHLSTCPVRDWGLRR
ncbi:Microsomal glutathione S-transferase 3 [Holothuria leucospilota]|uniref:Glutathione S-transferase 3, mitochondrial n=1 Tax=Holothuria leucospilota TaxID=206669 RepID=A0A9Q1BIR2_HOLLE|nr:Microsomal glutathione S-transferase 3 [Holothuria leucospilota]